MRMLFRLIFDFKRKTSLYVYIILTAKNNRDIRKRYTNYINEKVDIFSFISYNKINRTYVRFYERGMI